MPIILPIPVLLYSLLIKVNFVAYIQFLLNHFILIYPVVILFGIITFFSTLAGGLFALKFKDHLRLILGFSAGAIIGVVFFDLLPESISLSDDAYSVNTVTLFTLTGFLIYMVLDHLASLPSGAITYHDHVGNRGILGAASLSLHSLLDGVAIGLAFQISFSIGVLVTVAVLVHDFSDGINTVNIVLKDNGQRSEALRWLLVDSTMPVIGVISTFFYRLPQSAFGLLLALFAGFFLYIGASDLLPESYNRYPTAWTTLSAILGVAVIYAAIKFAGV